MREMLKVTFSLAKSIFESSLNIIENRLSCGITSLMGHRENFKYTNKSNLQTNNE